MPQKQCKLLYTGVSEKTQECCGTAYARVCRRTVPGRPRRDPSSTPRFSLASCHGRAPHHMPRRGAPRLAVNSTAPRRSRSPRKVAPAAGLLKMTSSAMVRGPSYPGGSSRPAGVLSRGPREQHGKKKHLLLQTKIRWLRLN